MKNNINITPDNRDPIFSYQPLWGSWTIDSLIGEGSYGKVYKATRTDMSHSFTSAIKIIRIPSDEQYRLALSSIGDDAAALKVYFAEIADYILNEINLLYTLRSNPNIITYEDHMVKEKENPLTWDIIIRMEYAESLPLYLSKKILNREMIIRLGIDICSAIDACVKNNIIHRDIKDENIFISKENIFKLGDFGIARELSKSGKAASMKGTPIFMSPEVFFGKKYDIRSDIYSLGIVMYKLLNKGRVPFMPPYPDKVSYTTSEAAMTKRLSGENFPFPTHSGKILGDIVLKACSFKKEDRYSTALEMRQVLLNALDVLDSAALNENITFLYGEDKPDKKNSTINIFDIPASSVNKEKGFSVKEYKKEWIVKEDNTDDKPVGVNKLGVFAALFNKSKDKKDSDIISEKLPGEIKTDSKNNTDLVKELKEQLGSDNGDAVAIAKTDPFFKAIKKIKKTGLIYSLVAVVMLVVIIVLVVNLKSKNTKVSESAAAVTTSSPVLETTPATIATTALEADAKSKIVFNSNRDGSYKIYAMNTDGSTELNLSNNQAGNSNDCYPSFSPDGSKIAFSSDRDGNSEIYLMNKDGSGQTRLTNNIMHDWDPSISPVGSKIAFSSDRDGNYEVYIMNTDGSEQTRLTNKPEVDEYPSFSFDGTKIAFSSERDENNEIYIMNADGSEQTRLTNKTAEDLYPSFSPDGTKIAFCSNRDGNYEIYIMNTDGSDQIRLTEKSEVDAYPSFSPDGSKIAFSSGREGNIEIYIMNTDGSEQTRLTNNAAYDFAPSFIPLLENNKTGINVPETTDPKTEATDQLQQTNQ